MPALLQRALAGLSSVQAKRPHTLQSFLTSALYAAQACLSVLVILETYRMFHIANPLWAVVSAVLILQPGLNQSLATSLTRVCANAIGAGTGALIQMLHGHGALGLCESLVIVVLLCEWLRLDLAVRIACSTTIIVMMPGGSVRTLGEERVFAVFIGCGIGMAVQLLTSAFEKFWRRVREHSVTGQLAN